MRRLFFGSRLVVALCLFALVLYVPDAAADATRHVPGMSLTAEILAENVPAARRSAPQADADARDAAPAAADSTGASRTPIVAPNTPGTITGYVRDEESGRGLPYTNIIVYRLRANGTPVQDSGSIALAGGQYFARVNPGRYEVRFLYLGYETFVAESVEVKPGETLTLDVTMKVKPIEFEAMTVQAAKITNTAVAQIQEKKRAVAVQEAITAEEISKSTDSDAAEALERVTGLSVVGGKFVFVRGLGDRYSSTTLNGAPLSSPEPGRETVPLDIFPAAMLDNIVVQKAYTPDMDGNFGGGNIDVRTRRGVDDRTFTQKISYGINQSVLDEDFLTYGGGATDLLALDDGTRDLGRMFPGFENVSLFQGTSGDRLAATFRGNNEWTPRRVTAPPNFGYSGLYSDRFEIGERPGTFLGAVSYSHSAKSDVYTRYNRDGSSEEASPARQENRTLESERGVLIGMTGAVTFQPTRDTNLQYNLLYTRGGEDVARVTRSAIEGDDFQSLGNTLRYVERDLLTHVVQGRHVIGGHGSELRWLASTSTATRAEPDNRYSRFGWRAVGVNDTELDYSVGRYVSPSPSAGAIVRLWGDTEETSRTLSMDWNLALPDQPWIQRQLKLGFSYRDRERDEAYRRFTLSMPAGPYDVGDRSGRLEDLITVEDYEQFGASNPGAFETREATSPYDSYGATRQVVALYGMFDVDLFETVRLSAGARFESSRQDAVSLALNGAEQGLPPILGDASREDWLPAANATWRITDELQTRVAYSQTVNRPQLREISAIRVFDYDIGEQSAGNPFLRAADVEALDFRLEYFPGLRSYAAFSAFDKTIDGAILLTGSALGGANSRVIFPANGGDGGKLRGWEVEWRGPMSDVLTAGSQSAATGAWLATRPAWLLGKVPGLGFFESLAVDHRRVDAFDLPALRNFGFTFNYTAIQSEIPFDRTAATNQVRFELQPDGTPEPGDGEFRTNRLTGQADDALNVGVFYGNGAQDVSLLLKNFGLQQVSVADATFYDPPLVLDAAFSTRVGPNAKLKLSVEDIFPGDDAILYRDFPHLLPNGEESLLFRFSETQGRKYGASLSYDF